VDKTTDSVTKPLRIFLPGSAIRSQLSFKRCPINSLVFRQI